MSENTPGHVGHEPEKHALPKVKTDFVPPGEHQPDPTYHSREPYPHAGESAAKPGAKSVQDQASKTDGNEGVLNQMAHKAAELYEGVKDKVAPALENVKEKASEAWHAVAGTIGAGPGSELKEDYTERLVAGQNETTRNNAQSSQQVRLLWSTDSSQGNPQRFEILYMIGALSYFREHLLLRHNMVKT